MIMQYKNFFGLFLLTIVVSGDFFTLKAQNSDEFVPQWAKSAVWYQIFPERFRNGDPSNDPEVKDIRGAYPHDYTSQWQIHPWGSDWYALQEYEGLNGKDIWFNILRRRYGGDLQGIIDKLGYLKDLGINAIYLNPIFESPSHHKYDGISFHHVDPNFGPDPEGDRKLIASEIFHDPTTWVFTSADKLAFELIERAHSLGIKIIFDGVFNHMGINSIPFQDILKNGKNSIYKDWFEVTSWEDPEKGTKFEYNGWFGVRELPEIKEDENGIVAMPKEYIFNATRRWMDPNGDGNPSDGIDGWRLDVAFCVKHQFWKDWRVLVKSINPEAYLTAEVIEPISELLPYLQGDEFDAVMNYNFAFASAQYLIADKKRIKTTEFEKRLEELRNAFPKGVAEVQQNLFGSHDANRLASHIVNKDLGIYGKWGEYFGLSKATNLNYNTLKPTKQDYLIQKFFVIFQFTYPGAPMIYYGDEVGMWGANDPDCRKPMIWDDIKYDNEVHTNTGLLKSSGNEVAVNQDLLNHYKKLIWIRNNNPALQTGSYETILADDETEIFGFKRELENQKIYIVLNNSDAAKIITPQIIPIGDYTELLTDNKINFNGIIEVPAKWGLILRAE